MEVKMPGIIQKIFRKSEIKPSSVKTIAEDSQAVANEVKSTMARMQKNSTEIENLYRRLGSAGLPEVEANQINRRILELQGYDEQDKAFLNSFSRGSDRNFSTVG